MALIQNQFYSQISLATISKIAKKQPYKQKLEFWECDVRFNLKNSNFNFEVIEPKINFALYSDNTNNVTFDNTVYNTELKRFWTKEEAENFIIFSLMQVFKPLNNYILNNKIDKKFTNIIENNPDKILKEIESGYKWFIN